MCGIAGFSSLHPNGENERKLLSTMADTLVHRGPDSFGSYVGKNIALAINRLSIVGVDNGEQPITNEDESVIVVCNGEIYDYLNLKRDLVRRGHVFRTDSDVEVLVHLYEEHGMEFLAELRGQFAFALYDSKKEELILARDHVGIAPIFYTKTSSCIVFASEIKAILALPFIDRRLNPMGVDQIVCFPGTVSPTTAFKDVESLEPGCFLTFNLRNQNVSIKRYWDLSFPSACDFRTDDDHLEALAAALKQAIALRTATDQGLAFLLSGGLDSSLLIALFSQIEPSRLADTFAVSFGGGSWDESRYQKSVADTFGCNHTNITISNQDLADRMIKAVYHGEAPVKETYNACSLALSETMHERGKKVVLGGEGADELFAGYPSYRLDQFRYESGHMPTVGPEEQALRRKLWGDGSVSYERDYSTFGSARRDLYSDELQSSMSSFDCLDRKWLDGDRLYKRHFFQQRSCLDFRFRLSDHLLGDHGDRMMLANSVEGRYPFLDLDVINVARQLPPHLKVHRLIEKVALKRIAEPLLPKAIVKREKFGFRAPGSPALLSVGGEFVQHHLSTESIKSKGVFNPNRIEQALRQSKSGMTSIDPTVDDDFLLIALSTSILMETFNLTL